MAIVAFITSLLPFVKWGKIVIIALGAILIMLIPTILPQFLEIQTDRIIARGTNSLNKAYNRSFKKCVFIFEDINDVYVEANKIFWICLKNGDNVSIPLNGHINKKEIIGLIYEVRAQLKDYEQQYVTNDTNKK